MRIVLVTSPRHFIRVFNPVSFYYIFNQAEELQCVVAEVNNTFGERHLYLLRRAEDDPGGYLARFKAPKAFHVSPFNDMEGAYEFTFGDMRSELAVHIDLKRGETLAFSAELRGRRAPLDNRTLLRTLLSHPLVPHLTMFASLPTGGQALFPPETPLPSQAHSGPPADHADVTAVGLAELVSAAYPGSTGRMDRGTLRITLPEGRRIGCGDPASEPRADLTIRDNRFFSRLFWAATSASGESYTDGDWDSTDLARLFELFIANRHHLVDGDFLSAALSRFRTGSATSSGQTPIPGSRRNIRAHYDLGNDFYRIFLGASMTYSCARFLAPDETLEEAQIEQTPGHDRQSADRHGGPRPGDRLRMGKLRGRGRPADRLPRHGDHRLARTDGVGAEERVRREGMEDRIDIRLTDYRHITGRFDRIVSIEMLEAVGHRRLGTFFGCCGCLLKPGGLMALQTITIPGRVATTTTGGGWTAPQAHLSGRSSPITGGHPGGSSGAPSLTISETEEMGPPGYAAPFGSGGTASWRRPRLWKRWGWEALSGGNGFITWPSAKPVRRRRHGESADRPQEGAGGMMEV